MVKPRLVNTKPKPYIAKCPQLSDAILIQMDYAFGGNTTEIVEYNGKFYIVAIDKPAEAG